MARREESPPRVFISYSHDSEAHEADVLAFSERLRADGIDARIDQYSPWPEEGWPRWMERELKNADFVLLVCTETYQRRVAGEEERGSGRGVCWEASLIYNELYKEKLETRKYLPILCQEGKEDYIPAPLQGHPYFRVDADDGYEDLYRCLTDQPRAVPRAIGQLKKLEQLQPLKESAKPGPGPGALLPTEEAESARFFISYPHGDPHEENLARLLHSRLTAAEHEVFIDMSIKAGADWVEEIKQRIRWCDYLVVLLSEMSMSSEMVQAEVRIARRLHRQTGRPRILPVRVRYEGPLEYELDMYLGHLQYLIWEGPEDSGGVFKDILKAAREPEEAGPPTPAERLRTDRQPHIARDPKRPQAALDARALFVPGGLVRHTDPYYIQRDVDGVVKALAPQLGETLVIKGPRQMGKSSLLMHYLVECKKAGKQIAFVDFSVFSNEDLSSYATFLSRLALVLRHTLKLGSEEPQIGSQFEMIQFVENEILVPIGGPLVIAFDEVDRVYRQPYRADFFTMLRNWHNNRSPLTPEWENLDLALVISTEPYLLI